MSNAEDVLKYGTEYAITQCKYLINCGVKGFHFYSLNKANPCNAIIKEIQE